MTILTIQETFEDVIYDVKNGVLDKDKFWVATRSPEAEESQKLWYIEVDLGAFKGESDKIKFNQLDERIYEFKIEGEQFVLHSCNEKVAIPDGITVTCLTISPDKTTLVAGTVRGDIIIYSLITRKILKEIKQAHLGNVTQTRVFPSNKVILTVGSDLTIKIWSLEGTEARKMIGHVQEITGAALLGKSGRNFVTSSRDGSVILWECGSGKVVYRYRRIGHEDDPATAVVTVHTDSAGMATSGLEFEIANQAVLVGYDSGIIQHFSLADHCQTRIRFTSDSKVETMDLFNSLLVTGHENGQINFWNVDLVTRAASFKLETGPISVVKILAVRDHQVTLVVYNGVELLLRLSVDLNTLYMQTTYLVGMEEAFRVNDIAFNHFLACGGSQLALYSNL